MYSKIVGEYFENPINIGIIEDANGIGITENEVCSDIIKIYIKVNERNIIENAKFQAKGCPPVIASCCVITEAIKNMTIEDTMNIDEKYIIKKLDRVPKEKEYCAKLVKKTLYKAIDDYKTKSMQNKK